MGILLLRDTYENHAEDDIRIPTMHQKLHQIDKICCPLLLRDLLSFCASHRSFSPLGLTSFNFCLLGLLGFLAFFFLSLFPSISICEVEYGKREYGPAS
jgi:hypothetical protein